MRLFKAFSNQSILLWFLLSLVVAAFMPLTKDEALYFVYGQNLAWGYHDHPPMVALFTSPASGYASLLLVRLIGVCGLTFAFWLGDRILWERGDNRVVFHWGWWMIPILHVYGIVTTPDVPLLIFTMVFWWVLHRFFREGKWSPWLIVVLALLMYSKYHAALVIALALFPMRAFWRWKPLLFSLLALLCFLPHIYWQYIHDWDTLRYHFVDRKGAFDWRNLGGFLGAQVLLFHPFLWYLFFRAKAWQSDSDPWRSLHKRVLIGLLLFFTLMVLRGRAEAHWAAAGTFSLLFLLSGAKLKIPMFVFRKWAFATVIVLVLVRVPLVVDTPLSLEFFEEREFMYELHDAFGDMPVAFMNSYPRPSAYMFYTGATAHTINNISGGLSQYQLWHYDTALVDRPFVWIANTAGLPAFTQKNVGDKQIYTRVMENYQSLEKLWFDLPSEDTVFVHGSNTLKVILRNKGMRPVIFGEGPVLEAFIFINYKKPEQMVLPLTISSLPDVLPEGGSREVQLQFELPDSASGDYWYKLSFRHDGTPNYINSHRCFFSVMRP